MPSFEMPPGACDCHMHVFESRFPLAANARHAEPDATMADYRKLQHALGLERVVVVQPTAYGKDNRCTLQAIADFGAGARGIAVVDDSVDDAQLHSMHSGGIRGVRFRMLDRPELPWELLPRMAARMHDVGWHIQFQMDGRELHTRRAELEQLPCVLVIEHMGKFLEPVAPGHPGFQALLRLLDTGKCWVKLSGAYMLSKSGPPHYEDIGVLARALVEHAPERLVWATNWPHPLAGDTPPDDALLLGLLEEWAPDPAIRRRILADNAAELYGFAL